MHTGIINYPWTRRVAYNRAIFFYRNEYCNFQPAFSFLCCVLFFFFSFIFFFFFIFVFVTKLPRFISLLSSVCKKFTYTQREVAVSRTVDTREFSLTIIFIRVEKCKFSKNRLFGIFLQNIINIFKFLYFIQISSLFKRILKIYTIFFLNHGSIFFR